MSSSTVAYEPMRELARGIERIYPSAVCSGIVGDKRHTRGYHKGRKFVPPRDYSVMRPDDRAGKGPDDGSAGVDITMNKRDMTLATSRLETIYHDVNDPRRKYVNAFNGWVGKGPATRYDVYARRKSNATRDHTWHLHLEKRRRYILDRVSNDAILSVLRGETVREWLTSRGINPGPAASTDTLRRRSAQRTMRAPAYPGRVLRRNDSASRPDPAVREWQQRMRERGWTSIGKADGYPGRRFERVVRAWQRTIKVRDDGMVGPVTWPTPWTRPMAGG